LLNVIGPSLQGFGAALAANDPRMAAVGHSAGAKIPSWVIWPKSVTMTSVSVFVPRPKKRTSMVERKTERKLAAIVAADIVNYSHHVGRDEEGTLERLNSITQQVIEPGVAANNGRIVNTAGDGFLIEFASVVDAVRNAVALQESMNRLNAEYTDEEKIAFRVGINLGDIVVRGDDILGDGVNIAARLESVAPPGGICLSRAAYEQIRGKLDLEFEFLGERELKNISSPIGVYQAIIGQDDQRDRSKSGEQQAKFSLPEKPSIAVLPFDNMSDDREQDYFADGITEDIITALSQFSTLFVIARNSCFTYKGRSVKAQEIRSELGVRYFAEGSVRKSGDRVRVTVQLIDSESGSHVWAERYDRRIDDIFEVQDELTQAIVATISGRIDTAEKGRIKRTPPDPMAALDYLLAGRIHHHRVTRQDNEEALRLLDKAIELAPAHAEAYAWKACTLGQALQFGYCKNPQEFEKEAIAAITKALSLDENNVECHRLLCEVYMETGQLQKAVVHGVRAHKMNPNDPRLVAQQGELKLWLGEPESGEEWIRQSMRLDPHGSAGRSHLLGYALYGQHKYADALEAFSQLSSPSLTQVAFTTAAYGQLGARESANENAERLLQLEPDFDIAQFAAKLPYVRDADRNNISDGLEKAGLA
jgi:adenylate cyclase